MMTLRPVVMFFVLLVIMICSPVHWRLHLVRHVDGSFGIFLPQHNQRFMREEVIKYRIMVSHERKIKQLKQLVYIYQGQLLDCHHERTTTATK